jgi:NAD(P)H-hydrate epimerase
MKTITEVPRLPRRKPELHKGEAGRVLVVGGSVGMAGAPTLAANAAYRSGAGLVRLAVPEPILNLANNLAPLATHVGLPASATGHLLGTRYVLERLVVLAEENDVLVVGPGMGRDDATDRLIRDLIHTVEKPIVLDADGLRALGNPPQVTAQAAGRLVLTPHPGEFACLTGLTAAQVQADRRGAVESFVAKCPAVVALKGHESLVADPERIYVNRTGNPGMATAGAGDVLSGIIGALVGQGLDRYSAAVLGVWVHGAAGDAAARDVGEIPLIATDLIDYLPEAFRGALDSGPSAGFAPRRD